MFVSLAILVFLSVAWFSIQIPQIFAAYEHRYSKVIISIVCVAFLLLSPIIFSFFLLGIGFHFLKLIWRLFTKKSKTDYP